MSSEIGAIGALGKCSLEDRDHIGENNVLDMHYD